MERIKKLYIVKREVIATSLQEALVNRGVVYSVELAEEKEWPGNKGKRGTAGFTNTN